MKKIVFKPFLSYITIIIFLFNAGCRKDSIKNPPMASLIIANAVVGGAQAVLGSYRASVPYNSSRQFVLPTGENDLYLWPLGDSLHPYFTFPKLNLEDREVVSLFLCGTVASGAEGIIVKENLPYHTDSVCGVRIVNLSPNSNALNITLSTSPTVNEVTNIAYKQYTNFKIYSAKAANVSYVFQVRKASDNSLLASYSLSTPRFANVTLVIRGLVGGVGKEVFGVFRINNDRTSDSWFKLWEMEEQKEKEKREENDKMKNRSTCSSVREFIMYYNKRC